MTVTVKAISSLVALILILGSLPATAQIHVDADAMGAADGSSWEDAFTDLQAALAIAGGSDQVWIAEGTYRPTAGSDRAAGFTLAGNQDGLAIYGGFDGTETMLAERDIDGHPVILSGDIGTPGVHDDNSFHVLWLDGISQGPITTATLFDGLTVMAGNADGASPDDSGGGLYCMVGEVFKAGECAPTLRNMNFITNSAATAGGAMVFTGIGDFGYVLVDSVFADNTATSGGALAHSGGSFPEPSISGCSFAGNSALEDGGALSIGQSLITNSRFTGNTAGLYGGAIHLNGGHLEMKRIAFANNSAGNFGGAIRIRSASPLISNAIFIGNHADFGGAIAAISGVMISNRPDIRHATFYGNSATKFGGALHNSSVDEPTDFEMINTILWANLSLSGTGDQVFNHNSTATLSHTVIQGGVNGPGVDGAPNTDGGNNLDLDPAFMNESDPAGPDGVYATQDDGLQLTAGSPVLDLGDNAASAATDLVGNIRIVDSDGDGDARTDAGAYELIPALIFADDFESPTRSLAQLQHMLSR